MSKTFVTGVFGSGKTTFAKEYSKNKEVPFINFDEMFDYQKSNNEIYVKNLYNNLPDNFVIDAIPFCGGWELFIEYMKKESNTTVIFTVCSNPIEWLNRIMRFKQCYMLVTPETVADLTSGYFTQYANMYYKNLTSIKDLIDYKIYDTSTNEYINEKELYIRINWAKEVYKNKE